MSKINYKQILEEVSNDTNYDLKDVSIIIKDFINVIKRLMIKGFKVNILSFCCFEPYNSKSKVVYNFKEKKKELQENRIIPKCRFVQKFKKEIKK